MIKYKQQIENILDSNRLRPIIILFLALGGFYIAYSILGFSLEKILFLALAGFTILFALVRPFIALCIITLLISKDNFLNDLPGLGLSKESISSLSNYSIVFGAIIIFVFVAQRILRRTKIFTPKDYILPLGIAFLVIMIISSINSGLTIANVQMIRVFILSLSLYFLVPVIINSPHRLRQFTWFVIVFGTFTSLVLLLRSLHGTEYALGAAARPTYIAAGLSLGLLLTIKSAPMRILFIFLLLFNLYAILIEAQKRPVVLVMVILIGFLITKRIRLGSFIIVACTAYLLTFLIPEYTLGRYQEVFQPSFSGSGRFVIWENAIEVIKHNPLFGIGPGNLQRAISRPAHNMYLGTMAEVGIFGFIILLSIIIAIIFNFRKSRLILKRCNNSFLFDIAFIWELIFYGWLAMWFFTATLPTTRFFWVIIGMSTAIKAIAYAQGNNSFKGRLKPPQNNSPNPSHLSTPDHK